jgi:hypothetical protein
MKPYTLPSSELPRLKTATGLKRLAFAMRLWHYCRRTRTTVARAHGRAFACWPLNRTASHGNTYAASAPTLQCAPSESTNCASTPPKSCFLGGMLNRTPLALISR